MPSSYPAGLDSLANPAATDTLDSLTVPHAEQHDKVNDAVEAIEATLGTNPQGSAPSVRARLEGVETLAASQITIATQQATIATNAATAAHTSELNVQANATTIATTAATTAAASATASANTAATNAAASSTLASDWAIKTSGTVSGGEWSAKHHAQAAATSATAASASEVAAANSAAAAAASYDSFDDRYLGAKASAPTVDNDGNALVQGALFYRTSGGADVIGMYVYDGAGWLKASAASVAAYTLFEFTATAGQTTITGADLNGVTLAYTVGTASVYLNGVLLMPGDDYTASNGSSVVLLTGATAGDSVAVQAFSSFTVANTYSIAQVDARIAAVEALALLGI